MLSKIVAVLAIIGSTSAYMAPMAIQGATAATIGVSALPLAANAKIRNDFRAPLVEIFDARGCDVKKQQYIGAKSNDMNDEQCVKVSMVKISVSEATAAKKLQEFVGGKASSINVAQIASPTKKY